MPEQHARIPHLKFALLFCPFLLLSLALGNRLLWRHRDNLVEPHIFARVSLSANSVAQQNRERGTHETYRSQPKNSETRQI